MKVYELMSRIGHMSADTDVICSAVLSAQEIKNGEQIDEDYFLLDFDVVELDINSGTVIIDRR